MDPPGGKTLPCYMLILNTVAKIVLGTIYQSFYNCSMKLAVTVTMLHLSVGSLEPSTGSCNGLCYKNGSARGKISLT